VVNELPLSEIVLFWIALLTLPVGCLVLIGSMFFDS
jgi:hypothetical protein